MRHTRWILAALLIVAALPAAAWGQEVCTDSVFAFVEGNSVVLMHTGALYNCCPTRFDYDVFLEGPTIVVREIEILENPCYCICCMDLQARINDVPPGEYVIEFHWYEYDIYDWVVWELPIVVPDSGQTLGDPYFAGSSHSDCYGTTPVPDDEPDTWTMIKILYR